MRAPHIFLPAILVLAFLLRSCGNLYDMPYGFHPDEIHYLHTAKMMMRMWTLNPAYFVNPPLYSYAILLALYGLFSAEYVSGVVASRAHFLATLPPGVAFGLARGLTALAGTATCLLLYLIGRKFGGKLAGLLAALFYAVAFLSVRDAHFAVNDVPMVCLVTLAFLFASRFLDRGRILDLALGGLTAGLATAAKYNGAVAFLPLLLAAGLRPPERAGGSGARSAEEIGGKWGMLLLFGIGGFLVGNPYAVLDSPAFLADFAAQHGARQTMWVGQSSTPVPLLAIEALVVELGWPLLLLAPLAAVYCVARGGPRATAALLASSVVVAVAVYHSFQSLFFARFLLTCTPFLALMCAWGIAGFREAAPVAWARRPIVLWGTMVLLVASPLARGIYLAVLLHRPDTRIQAKQYLDRVAPPGSTIVQEVDFYYTPPLDPQRWRLRSLSGEYSRGALVGMPADYFLFSSFAIGRVPGILEAEERALMAALEGQGFVRVTFSPLRGGGELPFELDQLYLPYRHLFRYERPGPTIILFARSGAPVALPPDGFRDSMGTVRSPPSREGRPRPRLSLCLEGCISPPKPSLSRI